MTICKLVITTRSLPPVDFRSVHTPTCLMMEFPWIPHPNHLLTSSRTQARLIMVFLHISHPKEKHTRVLDYGVSTNFLSKIASYDRKKLFMIT